MNVLFLQCRVSSGALKSWSFASHVRPMDPTFTLGGLVTVVAAVVLPVAGPRQGNAILKPEI